MLQRKNITKHEVVNGFIYDYGVPRNGSLNLSQCMLERHFIYVLEWKGVNAKRKCVYYTTHIQCYTPVTHFRYELVLPILSTVDRFILYFTVCFTTLSYCLTFVDILEYRSVLQQGKNFIENISV